MFLQSGTSLTAHYHTSFFPPFFFLPLLKSSTSVSSSSLRFLSLSLSRILHVFRSLFFLFHCTHKTQSLGPDQTEGSAVRWELCQQQGLLIVTIRLPLCHADRALIEGGLWLKHGSCPVDSSRAAESLPQTPTTSVL